MTTKTFDRTDIETYPPLAKPNDIAPLACTTGRQIRRMLNDGQLKGARIGSHWRVNTESFRAYFGI